MPAELLKFDPWLQEPVEAGVLTPQQAWSLEWERLAYPSRPYPDELHPLLQRIELYFLN